MPDAWRHRAGVLIGALLWSAGVAMAQETWTGAPAPGSFEEALANLPVEALHQVQTEDNLHLIAAYYYGDARQWPRLYGANRALIGRNPSVIHRGQVLTIRLPVGWAPLEPYDRFLARVRATGIPGLTAPPEAGGGKAAGPEAAAPTEEAPATSMAPASPGALETPSPPESPEPPAPKRAPATSEESPTAPGSY